MNLGQTLVMPHTVAYGFVLVAGAALFVTGYRTAARRRAAGLTPPSVVGIAVKRAGADGRPRSWSPPTSTPTAAFRGCSAFSSRSSSLIDYALKRTQWGRCMTAVGGNREAARRAGIDVRGIYMGAFVLCSTLAALGGVLSAARLASASQQAGTGDVNLNAIAAAVIGGTSLFGGRGSAYSALLGIIVIQSIASGLTLLDLSSSLRYMITGGVLAIAVIVDSLARRSRASHGRG